ncbi:MAG: sigma-54-dependent Fis family transcriptional regulator [Bdellovibrionaceae bacterium]|nr:sigma-54-dependent Fis family transcriptional regulator [Pseudobdellovibrionaceae bacterium]
MNNSTDIPVLPVKEKVFSMNSRNADWNLELEGLFGVAQTEFPVLLLGPSGTGKDVVAQALHKHSGRCYAPFVSVNCSALTETLIESELFGHVRGSFTGAMNDRKGAFESARGGTLFLDEIGDLSYNLQAKLLRALENSEIRPVGSDRIVKTNVRIIAATHQNLVSKIQEGQFRSDLFFRLNVVSVQTPALKDRIEDFDDLIYTFAKQMRVRFSFDAIQRLKGHSWPGNIRELKNLVSRASALFPSQQIDIDKADRLLRSSINLATIEDKSERKQVSVLKEVERQIIIRKLEANGGNQKRTALDLGMPKSTLNDRLRQYNINARDFKGAVQSSVYG